MQNLGRDDRVGALTSMQILRSDITRAEMAATDVTGMVFNVMRYSVKDGPGLRTTVFLKGCPLSCLWCHNPESQAEVRQVMVREDRCIACGECVAACPEEAISVSEDGVITVPELCDECGDCTVVCYAEARQSVGEERTVAEVMTDILKDRAFFEESKGGVTFSGGEPLSQPDFLDAMLASCRAEGIHTTVDTAGAAPWSVIERVRRRTDLFLYDLKLMDEARHRTHVGASNRLILDNLGRLAAAGNRIVVRMPIVPGYNDDDDNLDRTGGFVAALPGVPEVRILPDHATAPEKYRLLGRTYEPAGTVPPSAARMDEIAGRLRRFGLTVSTGV